MGRKLLLVAVLGFLCLAGSECMWCCCICSCYASVWWWVRAGPGCVAQEEEEETLSIVDDDLGASREGSRTDAEAVER